MSKHVIHFYGPITPRSFEGLRNVTLDALTQNPERIELLLSSEGGDLNSGFTAYNFLRSLQCPLTIINMGTVESIALVLYLAATDRLSVSNGRFLIHSLHWGFGGPTSIDHGRLAEHSSSLDYDLERYADIFQERTDGADAPLDILGCLKGAARILDVPAAVSAGITSGSVPAEWTISASDTHWWPPITF